jgi:hypothetical protein
VIAALRSSGDGDSALIDLDRVVEMCSQVVELLRVVLQATWAHQTVVANGHLNATGATGAAANVALLLPVDVLRIFHSIIFTVWSLSRDIGAEERADAADNFLSEMLTVYASMVSQLVAEHDRTGVGRTVAGPYLAPLKVRAALHSPVTPSPFYVCACVRARTHARTHAHTRTHTHTHTHSPPLTTTTTIGHTSWTSLVEYTCRCRAPSQT